MIWLFKSVCWLTRNCQSFRGRWRLMTWLKKRDWWLNACGRVRVKTKWGHYIIVTPFEFIGRYIFIEGEFEQDCESVFESLLCDGDCFLDIGSNIGYFTLLGSHLVGKKGEVFSFEASPEMMKCLDENVRLNNLYNVHLYQNAVSDAEGDIAFHIATSSNSGLSSIRNIDASNSRTITVQCFTIDSLLDILPKVKLVKIDVEGAEYKVLTGMRELIKRDNPCIIFELTDEFLRQMGSSAQMVYDYLNGMGYTLYAVEGNRFIESTKPPDAQCNIFARNNVADLLQ